MGYCSTFEKLDTDALRRAITDAKPSDVERALSGSTILADLIPALFSPAADNYLEEIVHQSAALTERRFGKVIQLYAPLYLSNECVNHCLYCGFSKSNAIDRTTLSPDQVTRESEALYEEGFRHILLVSGESPGAVGFHYLTSVIRRLHNRFASISLEIFPLDTDGYCRMNEAGADGLTLYQETYDPELYAAMHPKGPKRDFTSRLDSHDRAGQAGFRSLGIGSLLGLGDWRFEGLMVALHGLYLTRHYWKSKVAVSFPRLRAAQGSFRPEVEVTDRDVVHLMGALRILLPDAEMVISTRENADFRDNLIGLGVTRMSAGSKTRPGGYRSEISSGEQFQVEDSRSPAEVAEVIVQKKHEPVWKDFDREFITNNSPNPKTE